MSIVIKMVNRLSIKTKFNWITAFEINDKIISVKFGKIKNSNSNKVLRNFKQNILNFFNKKNSRIKSAYAVKGSKVQKMIWREIKQIKVGKTKSYGEIAKKYKLSPRHVGKICGQNEIPLIIPCHRVIRSNGEIGGYSANGGIKLKKKLLEFEKEFI